MPPKNSKAAGRNGDGAPMVPSRAGGVGNGRHQQVDAASAALDAAVQSAFYSDQNTNVDVDSPPPVGKGSPTPTIGSTGDEADKDTTDFPWRDEIEEALAAAPPAGAQSLLSAPSAEANLQDFGAKLDFIVDELAQFKAMVVQYMEAQKMTAMAPARPPPPAAPLPAVDAKLAEQFVKQGATKFNGNVESVEADMWIRDVDGFFMAMRCRDSDKVALAAEMMEGDAARWWNNVLRHRFGGNAAAVTWDGFASAFRERYVTSAARRRPPAKNNSNNGEFFSSNKPSEMEHRSQMFGNSQQGAFQPSMVGESFMPEQQQQPEMRMMQPHAQSALGPAPGKMHAPPPYEHQQNNNNNNNSYNHHHHNNNNPMKRKFDSMGGKQQNNQMQRQQQQQQGGPHGGGGGRGGQNNNRRPPPGGVGGGPSGDAPVCTTCGKRHRGVCRQGGRACLNCGQSGHMQRNCPSNNVNGGAGGPPAKRQFNHGGGMNRGMPQQHNVNAGGPAGPGGNQNGQGAGRLAYTALND